MTATVRRGRCKTRRRRGVATAVLLVLAAAGAAGAGAAAQAAEPVDLELVLAVDTSGSIDLEEARLQRDGYIAALGDDRVISTILSGPLGRVALSYVEWGGAEQQSTLIDWTLIDDKESARGFAARLVSAPNVRATRTSISAAMDYIVPMFASNEFVGSRRVIDISGDGPNNSGRLVNLARDWAVASGITVNGLPVINDRPNRYGLPGLPDLDLYFENCVIGGPARSTSWPMTSTPLRRRSCASSSSRSPGAGRPTRRPRGSGWRRLSDRAATSASAVSRSISAADEPHVAFRIFGTRFWRRRNASGSREPSSGRR